MDGCAIAQKGNRMKVMLFPGPRNEELISLIKKVKDANNDEAWELLDEYEGTEEYLDALFYACECGEEMLREQTEYFQWLLLNEENEYYIDRMLADYNHQTHLDILASEVEKHHGVAAELYLHDCKTHKNYSVIYAIREHAEGWEYYLLDDRYRSIEDGVYDQDAPISSLLKSQFDDWGLLLNRRVKLLDLEAVIGQYEASGNGVGWEILGR